MEKDNIPGQYRTSTLICTKKLLSLPKQVGHFTAMIHEYAIAIGCAVVYAKSGRNPSRPYAQYFYCMIWKYSNYSNLNRMIYNFCNICRQLWRNEFNRWTHLSHRFVMMQNKTSIKKKIRKILKSWLLIRYFHWLIANRVAEGCKTGQDPSYKGLCSSREDFRDTLFLKSRTKPFPVPPSNGGAVAKIYKESSKSTLPAAAATNSARISYKTQEQLLAGLQQQGLPKECIGHLRQKMKRGPLKGDYTFKIKTAGYGFQVYTLHFWSFIWNIKIVIIVIIAIIQSKLWANRKYEFNSTFKYRFYSNVFLLQFTLP